MVTVAMKRVDMANPQDDLLAHIRRPGIRCCPTPRGFAMPRRPCWRRSWPARPSARTSIAGDPPRPEIPAADPVETLRATEGAGPAGLREVLPTSRRTRSCANVSKRPMPPPSCRSRRRSAPTRGSSRARCSKSSSNRATSPSWSTPGWGAPSHAAAAMGWAPTPLLSQYGNCRGRRSRRMARAFAQAVEARHEAYESGLGGTAPRRSEAPADPSFTRLIAHTEMFSEDSEVDWGGDHRGILSKTAADVETALSKGIDTRRLHGAGLARRGSLRSRWRS